MLATVAPINKNLIQNSELAKICQHKLNTMGALLFKQQHCSSLEESCVVLGWWIVFFIQITTI